MSGPWFGVGRHSPYTLPLVKATVEPLEGNKVKLSVEVEEAEFDKAIDAAFRKIAKEVRIKGFRPGKAPRKVLESQFGHEVGRQQALQDSLDGYFQQALVDQDVDAIASEEVNITSGETDGPLIFDAVVEVRPEVQVAGYDGLRVELEPLAVPDEDVDAQIDRMRQMQSTLEPVDRPAQDDDTVTIDIAGSLDGEPQEGLTAEDYSYPVGSGGITPEIDENLRGAKAGDVLEFDATHPDEDEERDLTFRVLVKQVNASVLPDADDAWAAENSEFSTIEEYRESIRQNMAEVRREHARRQLPDKVGEALARLVDLDPPQALLDQETRRRAQDLQLRMRAQGIDLNQMAEAGALPENMAEQLREGADDAVKADLGLRAVARAEGLTCTDEDLDAEIEQIATAMRQKPQRVRDEFERGGQISAVRSDVEKQKALDWLLERVEIVDTEGQAIDRADLEPKEDEPAGDSASGSVDDDETESDPE
jgi:trigger factor